MITVEEAEKIIQAELRDYGVEIMPFELTLGRVLAENIKADRDLPPFNRVTMDGIAVNYAAIENGQSSFHIKAVQAAGDFPVEVTDIDHCIEIMTGAAMPSSLDTIIRYEDLEIRGDLASLVVNSNTVKKGQNIHLKGRDKKKDDIVATTGQLITPAIISLVASVGETELRVKKQPRVVIISSGDELVEVEQTPLIYQIRKSNNYTIKAILQQHNIEATMVHIPDDAAITQKTILQCLQNYDVLLLSGGISMGKFDYIPKALEELQVEQLVHKVKQRPGKPFWFGRHGNGTVVFAFPGNPVATFMCMHRYFLPWLQSSLELKTKPTAYAVLDSEVAFHPELQYFLQVDLNVNADGRLMATPIEGNGSGDFANLAYTDAFMELPWGKNKFRKGEAYRIWSFNQLS